MTALRAEGRRALVCYVTAGHPDPASSVALLRGIESAGADVIELGIPFSDPMADGPIIQASSQRALDHGMTLGNHTYSHPDLNALTVEQYENEIAKGDVVTRHLMRARQPYQLYFRHPMTHTGDTQEKKEAIEKFLAARGYKVTPHTIENSDFIFNVPYAAALNKKDETLAQLVREEYIAHTIAATEFAERISPQVFGREIPQTLLIHVNDITADCLDEMLTKFEARGYTFVTLDAVIADPAYTTKDTFVGKHGPSWLFRWMKSKGMNVDFTGDPDPPKWIMDSYNKIQGFTNE